MLEPQSKLKLKICQRSGRGNNLSYLDAILRRSVGEFGKWPGLGHAVRRCGVM